MSKNTSFLPMEIIEQAVAGEPKALEAVIQHFSGYIRYLSYRDGQYNADIQERLEAKLMAAVLRYALTLTCSKDRKNCQG